MIAYIFLLAAVLGIARLLRGPSFADRALAANALADVVALFMVFYTFTVQAGTMYLDIAISIVMLSVVGTLSVAKYAIRNGGGKA